MDLRRLDLNLLVVFDALMSERHVSRAADRIALSQPAMSNALSRLRATLDDPILVRTSRGMEPTPRALELHGPIHAALTEIQHTLFHSGALRAAQRAAPFRDRRQRLHGVPGDAPAGETAAGTGARR